MTDAQKFVGILKQYRSLIWPTFEPYLEIERVDGVSDLENGEVMALHKAIVADYPQRMGKYIRAALVALTVEAMGGEVSDGLLTAAAMEASQNWLLIHDDFQDGSMVRRGEPTLHLKYNPELAINAGDTLHLIMWQMLRDNEARLGAKKTLQLMDEFYRMLMRTSLGQTTDLYHIYHHRFDLSLEDCYYIMDGKTSYYTIAGPMRLGAIIVEDDEGRLGDEIFPKLDAFGLYLGRAFQIIDDVLDVTSDFDAQKEKGNDVYEGKRTVVLSHLLGAAEAAEREKILAIYGKPGREKSAEEVAYVLDLMEARGSIAYAQEIAADWAGKARKAFDDIGFFVDGEAREKIRLGIDFMIDRTY
ncbi:MAG TPA: polyprenyl synthetase family protein [Anaerolineae bacterium]|nr:polyprenyl synthetase family protein [Anaerolineae bacterium]